MSKDRWIADVERAEEEYSESGDEDALFCALRNLRWGTEAEIDKRVTELKEECGYAAETEWADLSDGELLAAMGTDARKWTAALYAKFPYVAVQIDRDTMLGWFANAIEAGRDAGLRATPDSGSGS